jgi:CheY-like chemotaxis protein
MVRSDLPPALDPVVMRCLAKSPSMRYQHCEELAQALLPFIRQAGKQSASDFVGQQARAEARTPSPPPPEPPAKVDTESARKLANLRAHPHFLAIKRSGVLVADPDPSFRTRVLEAAEAVLPGCRFHAARTNTSALDLARKSPPAILIAGVNDARLNGLELTAMIRGDDRLKGIQVVLTADKITSQDKAILSRMGVCKTVIKTSEGNELKSAIFAATSASLALAFKTSGA